jgi:GT2 family glycosyltransferase
MRVGRRVVDALRSPRRLGAFVARLARLALRGELPSLLGRIQARGFTANEYRDWAARQPKSVASLRVPFVICVDVGDEEASRELADALRTQLGSTPIIVARGKDGWRESVDQAPRSLRQWVASQGEPWLLWIAAPLHLSADATNALSAGCAMPGARVVYGDHVVVDEDGVEHPAFVCAWDRIRIGEQPYAAPILAIDASLTPRVESSSGGVVAQWRLLIDAVASMPETAIVHVPRIVARVHARNDPLADRHARAGVMPALEALAASQRVSISGEASRTPWLTYRPRTAASASIVIPTRDRPDLLQRCIDSVLRGGWPEDAEIVVVDNGSKDPRLLDLLRSLPQRALVRTIALDIPFNFPLLCNAGVEAARGRVVILLNNDAEVRAGWLDELVPLATRTDVGAVGPLVLYPDGRIQSAGVLVGVNRTATSALEGFDPRTRAAQEWCASRRRVSAVLGACMAIERDKYMRHGGLDATFAVSHNEVDFCLRLEASRFANVFTPFASVVHVEGATRGFEVTETERARLEREETEFLARWGAWLNDIDPAHHGAFARSGNPFLLAPGSTSLPPRAGWRSSAGTGVGGADAMPG